MTGDGYRNTRREGVRALCSSQRMDAMTRVFVMRAPGARGEARSQRERRLEASVVASRCAGVIAPSRDASP